MRRAEENAPLFIEAFYRVCMECADDGLGVPEVGMINRLLAEYGAGYRIAPHLVATIPQTPLIPVPDAAQSLDAQARTLIELSLEESHRSSSKGEAARRFLKSVATVFRGTGTSDGTIQGKYFNKIIGEMRSGNRGTAQGQILDCISKFYGYLSSPTGGGIRHGMDLKAGIAIQQNEVRLYCNLIRSYITYLIEEHDRLQKIGTTAA